MNSTDLTMVNEAIGSLIKAREVLERSTRQRSWGREAQALRHLQNALSTLRSISIGADDPTRTHLQVVIRGLYRSVELVRCASAVQGTSKKRNLLQQAMMQVSGAELFAQEVRTMTRTSD